MPDAQRNSHSARRWPRGFLAFAVVATGLLLLGLAKLLITGPGPVANATAAVGRLLTLIRDLDAYAAAHEETGYPETLQQLHLWNPELGHEHVLDGIHRGYAFTYTPGPRDPQGRISTYTLQARPLTYGEDRSSFFADESGILRFTREDRPATATDPPVR